MGLDMYLRAEVYIGGWEHSGEDSLKRYKQALKIAGLPINCPGSPSLTISATVAYWRKANAIHQWFVDNVQEDSDDCKSYYVSIEQLTELRDTCQKVLDSTKLHEGLVTAGWTSEGADPEVDLGYGKGFRPILEEGKMMVNSDAAEELLPAQSGFFFGSTDYDEWYVQNLRDTVEQIDRALDLKNVDFYYQSSW